MFNVEFISELITDCMVGGVVFFVVSSLVRYTIMLQQIMSDDEMIEKEMDYMYSSYNKEEVKISYNEDSK